VISLSIRKRLGAFQLDASFELSTNRCVIFGPSGSGKSSLLKMIAGFFDPDEGRIIINGKCYFDSKRSISLAIQKRNVGYLPQEYTLFPHMKVRQNIEYGLKKRKIREFLPVEDLVKRFGIDDCMDRYPSELSGGQRQRAALVRALVVKPDLLLLDEPFSALDKPIREELRTLVADVSETFDIPVLFVTHDPDEAFVFADQMVIIKDGIVLECDYKERVFNAPRFVETALLFNFFNIWHVKEATNGSVKLRNGYVLKTNAASCDYVSVKPENVMILRPDADFRQKENVISVVVERLTWHNRYVSVSTRTDDGMKIRINVPEHVIGKMRIEEGVRLRVSLDRGSLIPLKVHRNVHVNS